MFVLRDNPLSQPWSSGDSDDDDDDDSDDDDDDDDGDSDDHRVLCTCGSVKAVCKCN